MPSNDRQQARLGVLAFGDSITNGGGELQWGVALQSWALWVARAVGLPYTACAVDGARVQDVMDDQIPAFERFSAHPDGTYDLGCLYIGVNDVRCGDWHRGAFGERFVAALGFLGERCDRVLTMTAPLDLGRPRAGRRVVELDETIEAAARRVGALVVDLRPLRARNLVMADHVHPTAFGQIAIAERALAVLQRDGMPTRVAPRSLIRWETSWLGRLRSDATYAYRHAKVSARAAALSGATRARTTGHNRSDKASGVC